MSDKPYIPGTFDLRPRPVAPKAAAPGAWETALRQTAAMALPTEPPPRPTGSRLRQRRWDALYDPGSRQRGLNATESDERG